jgi:hypothetical protein
MYSCEWKLIVYCGDAVRFCALATREAQFYGQGECCGNKRHVGSHEIQYVKERFSCVEAHVKRVQVDVRTSAFCLCWRHTPPLMWCRVWGREVHR